MKNTNSAVKPGSKPVTTSNQPSKSGSNPNYPSSTGNPSGKGRGNTPKK